MYEMNAGVQPHHGQILEAFMTTSVVPQFPQLRLDNVQLSPLVGHRKTLREVRVQNPLSMEEYRKTSMIVPHLTSKLLPSSSSRGPGSVGRQRLRSRFWLIASRPGQRQFSGHLSSNAQHRLARQAPEWSRGGVIKTPHFLHGNPAPAASRVGLTQHHFHSVHPNAPGGSGVPCTPYPVRPARRKHSDQTAPPCGHHSRPKDTPRGLGWHGWGVEERNANRRLSFSAVMTSGAPLLPLKPINSLHGSPSFVGPGIASTPAFLENIVSSLNGKNKIPPPWNTETSSPAACSNPTGVPA
ncbi:uncharacterized protein CLUP02_01949 [Colletotrichum lupini]|uniref:Uncharacterized protein n=1 Tax=Colletotrichum lupini TaxID=145971 RepID=A0A9Q8SE29_9PEZI|nr:uncharacterized protein CLUP02_01949 [Colletotrichum lupini]UQC75295.1 hypothetical protein CLUP02_01949 [Colletotrichum lupini]